MKNKRTTYRKHPCPDCGSTAWKTVAKQQTENGIVLVGRGKVVQCRYCGWPAQTKKGLTLPTAKKIQEFAAAKANKILGKKEKPELGYKLKRKGKLEKEIEKDVFQKRGMKHFGNFRPVGRL